MSNRIDALTGLRFFAALAIVFHHLNGVLWIPANHVALNQGVSFFFVLSGFILQHSYRSRLGEIGISQFYLLRFFRIWPSHVVIAAILFLLNRGATTIGQLILATFLLQAWSPNLSTVFLLNGPSWSLSVEMIFYVLFPFLCLQALKQPVRPLLVTALITGLWLVFLVLLSLHIPVADFFAWTGTNPLARLFEFGIGVSAYEIFRGKATFRRSFGTALEIAAIGLVALSVAMAYPIMIFIEPYVPLPLAYWFGNCGSFGVFAALILIFFRSEGLVSRFVAWKPVVFLGEISFALYLVHSPIILGFHAIQARLNEINIGGQIALFAAALLTGSVCLHFLIEKPCMAFAKRLFIRRTNLSAS